MKKIIALLSALVMVLSLAGCFGAPANNGSTADEAQAAAVDTYQKDFEGLQKYITDRNNNSTKQEIYYDIVGASDGARIILNGNAFVEIYDFDNPATEDSANTAKAQEILAAVKKDGKFRPMDGATELTAVITKSGRYVIAWDATRGYDYDKKVAPEELKNNW